MTNETETPKPKKSIAKKVFWIIAIVLGLFGIDHFTYNFAGIGASVTVTDSTVVVAPIVDTTPVAVEDTTAKDTTRK